MSKEQIIIDGVDVSGCLFFTQYGFCTAQLEILGGSGKCSVNNQNCYYKQLKAKEQECERLKEDYSTQLQKNIEKQCRIRELQGIVATKEFILKVNGKKYTGLSGIDKAKLFINSENYVRDKKILELEDEISSLQWKFYDNCKLVVDANKKLDQLKAENEELKKQNNQFDNGINEQFSKIIELEGRNNLLKQILTEIKEIAEKMKKMSEEDGGELTECFFIDKQCEKCSEDKCLPYWFGHILQKISEVING